jgi:ATP-dependent DNA helicase DinG
VRLRWAEAAADDALAGGLAAVATAAREAASALQTVSELAPDFVRLHERALELAARADAFAQPAQADRVRWVDLTAQHVRLVDSALDIRDLLAAQRAAAPKAWVFTSATLGDDERLSWFTAQAALEDARTLRVGSPFDYAAHARLWVPRTLPPPAAPGHSAAVAALAARCALALGGRTFVLTTTLRALQAVADALPGLLAADGPAAGSPIEVLVQGSEPKRRLLQRFVDGPPAVLVGSHSFWEGIDVVGDALQCVLIDKLPFPPPADPLVEARVRRLEAEGRSAFNDYFVPEAAVALKQGAGRLIRSESDRGLLVICDPRMAEKGYGQRLRRALPPMGWVAREDEAIDWLHRLRVPA